MFKFLYIVILILSCINKAPSKDYEENIQSKVKKEEIKKDEKSEDLSSSKSSSKLVLSLMKNDLDTTDEKEKENIQSNILSDFIKNMALDERNLKVNLISLTYKEDLDVYKEDIEVVLANFETYINSLENKEDISKVLIFLKKKILDLKTSNRFSENKNKDLAEKNRIIAIEKLKEIFHFLKYEKDLKKISKILKYLEGGFSNSGARTMLEIENSLYEVKQFLNLENKINFLLNKSRELYLEFASGEEIYNKLGAESFENPHLASYMRNVMKDLLKLNEDYYSEEDFTFYNRRLSKPIDKDSIVSNFIENFTPEVLINSIEEYISNEEIENYITKKFSVGDGDIKEILKSKEEKIETIKAILIDMGHLAKK